MSEDQRSKRRSPLPPLPFGGSPPDPLTFLAEGEKGLDSADRIFEQLDQIGSSTSFTELKQKLSGGRGGSEHTSEKTQTPAQDVPSNLQDFIDNGNIESLEKAYDDIMKESDCQACRMFASSAYSEAKYGNIEKAKFTAKEVLKNY